MCGDTSARAADSTRLGLAQEILLVRENPTITMGQRREEVAEPEGQPTQEGHPWWSIFLFPQERLILSARCAGRNCSPPRAGTQTFPPCVDPIKLLLCLVPIPPFSCPCKFPSGYFSPMQRHLPFPSHPYLPLQPGPTWSLKARTP